MYYKGFSRLLISGFAAMGPAFAAATVQAPVASVQAQTASVPATAQTAAVSTTAQTEAAPVTAQTQATPVTAQTEAAPTTAQTEAAPVTAQTQATPVTAQTEAAPVTAQTQATPVTAQTNVAPANAKTSGAPSTKAQSRLTIILDPGHGGSDAGAVVKGQQEKDICLGVALRVQKILRKQDGPRVILTRDSDNYVTLDQRVANGADIGSAIFVSIHANASDDKNDNGIVVYSFGHAMNAPKSKHRPVPALAPPPDDESLASAIMASSIARSLRSQGLSVQGVIHSDYYVLKNPYHPSVLVEIGYLSNHRDYKRLSSKDYRQKLAEALAHSLTSYIAQQNKHQMQMTVSAALHPVSQSSSQ